MLMVYELTCIWIVTLNVQSKQAATLDEYLDLVTATQELYCIDNTLTCSSKMSKAESDDNWNATDGGSTGNGFENTGATNRTILPNLPVEPPENMFGNTCCLHNCSCDNTTCRFLGTCCVDAFDYLPSVEESRSTVKLTCEYPQLRQNLAWAGEFASANHAVKMIRQCPKTLLPQTVVDRCEKPELFDGIVTNMPVVDRQTLVSYQNKYCAHCNGVSVNDLVLWRARVDCLISVYKPRNIWVVATEIPSTFTCNLIFGVPTLPGLVPAQCDKVISSCNETGLWKVYDATIERACHAYTTIYAYTYKNVFCYMCNTGEETARNFCPFSGFSAFVTYSVVFDDKVFWGSEPEEGGSVNQTTGGCSSALQTYDPVLNRCHDLQCKFPKYLNNRECENMIEEFYGVAYDIVIELTPLEEDQDMFILRLAYPLYDRFYAWLGESDIPDVQHSLYRVLVSTYGPVYDDAEQPEYALIQCRLYFEVYTDTSILDYVLGIDDPNSSVFHNIELYDGNYTLYNGSFKARISHWHTTGETTLDTTDLRTNSSIFSGLLILTRPPIPLSPGQLEMLTKFHHCPLVVFEEGNVTLNRTENGYYLEEYDSEVAFEDIIVDAEAQNVCMCSERFEAFVQQKLEVTTTTSRQSTSDTNTTIDGIVDDRDGDTGESKTTVVEDASLTCTLISVVFAILTFCAIGLVKRFRTQVGYNNMTLAFYCVMAQCLFQFGVLDLNHAISDTACKAIGVLVHYSWLLLAMWTHTCVVHAIRSLHSRQPNAAPKKHRKTWLLYNLYTWTVASVPVIINIFVAIVKSKGHDMGYHPLLCYINNTDMNIYTAIVPMAVLVGINFVLYIGASVHIQRTPTDNDTRSEQRALVGIYSWLSILVCGIWLFGFLSLTRESVWVECVFVALSALLGLSLFVVFLVKAKVVQLKRHAMQNNADSKSVTLQVLEPHSTKEDKHANPYINDFEQ